MSRRRATTSDRAPDPAPSTAAEADVVLVGDTYFGESYRDTVTRQKLRKLLVRRGYDSCFESFAPLLRQSDLVVMNLETPLTLPGGSPLEGRKRFLHHCDPVDAPDCLARHNVGVVSLANNHSLDYGRDALRLTIDVLRAHGIAPIGVGADAAEAGEGWSTTLPVGEGGQRLTILAAYWERKKYVEQYRVYATKRRGGVCRLEGRELADTIEQLKSRDENRYVVVYPHWGSNYAARDASQVTTARRLVDAGADLIVGHGAHLAQAVERYRGRWILYGLGNFVFNSPGRFARKGVPALSLVARLTLRAQSGGRSQRLRLYPIFTDNRVIRYQPRFATRKEIRRLWRLITDEAERDELERETVQGEDEYGRYVELLADTTS